MSIPSNETHPAGGTWFDTLRRSFVDVPVDSANDNAVPTTEFLEAAESLTTLFDVLGSMAFTPVKNDMIGNIKKVRDRQLASPATSTTLQSLVLDELAPAPKKPQQQKQQPQQHTATEGLLWLVRGLAFTLTALTHNLSHPADELSTSFRAAYASTLKPHHSFMVKPVFSAAMSATPYKKDFYAKMGGAGEGGEEKVREAMRVYVRGMGRVVQVVQEFQDRKEAKW